MSRRQISTNYRCSVWISNASDAQNVLSSLLILAIEPGLGSAQEFETMTNSLQMTFVASPKVSSALDRMMLPKIAKCGWLCRKDANGIWTVDATTRSLAGMFHRFCKEAEYVTSYEKKLGGPDE